jgi:[acyl-carrier-protein] S-malonyltransferase
LKVALLFPGQGAQAIGMGRQACETLPAARALFERAGDILGYDLSELCFRGPAQRLHTTVCCQPALFVCGLAHLEVLKQRSPDVIASCQAAAGLSLGEYTALVCAGALDFEHGLRLVQQRAEAMQAASDAVPSGMLSVLGMEREPLERLCEQVRGEGEVLQVANHLCPGNLAVSGHRSACARLAEAALAAGAMKAVPLEVAGAFHTPLMGMAGPKLAAAIQQTPFSAPRFPVISNVDARPHRDPVELREVLIRQVVSPVQWEESMRYLLDQGFDTFYELGPGRVLRGILKRIQRKACCEGVLEL